MGTLYHTRVRYLKRLFIVLIPSVDVFFYIKFFLHSSEGHRTYESVVCFLRWERSVMLPKAPRYTCVSIWATTIDCVGIVEIDTDSIRFFPISEPSCELFSPVHADITVYFPCSEEFVLSCIPERVFGFSLLEVFERILLPGEERSLFFSVFIQCFYDPIRETIPLIWVLLVVPHIDGELSPNDTLFEEGKRTWFFCLRMEFVIYLER